MDEASLGNITLSPNVIESVIGITVNKIAGVAGQKKPLSCWDHFKNLICPICCLNVIHVVVLDKNHVDAKVYIDVNYGVNARQISNEIRNVVANALDLQLGLKLNALDVYIEDIR